MSSAKTMLLYLAAASVRLVLAPFTGHSWDVYVWVQSGELFSRGINVYEVKSLTDFPWGFYTYPPVWLYWVSLVSLASSVFTSLNLQVLILKTPIIAADLAVALLTSKIAGELGMVRHAGKAALLWMFNPLVITISSVWGMFDSVAVALSLYGLLLMLRGRTIVAGFVLGLGGAVKIFPLMLVVPSIVYMRFIQNTSMRNTLTFFGAAATGFTLPAVPFLNNPLPLIDKLLYHFGNIGSFSYWTVLSVVSPPPAIPIISYGFFAALLYYSMKQGLGRSSSLFELWTATLLAFLATSAKVNVQYVLWVLPLLLLYVLYRRSRELYLNTALLILAGLLFVASAQAILAIFDLRNIGRIVVSREVESLTLGGALLIFSGLLGGSRFITLFVNLLRETSKTVWTLQRITFISLIIIFSLVVGLLPTGHGITLPQTKLRVGVSEGLESLFDKVDEYNAEFLVERFKLTHVVFPIGPDGVLYGGDYSKSFRFKLSNNEWTQQDIRKLVEAVKSAGVRPLLGVYLKSSYTSVHYGYHGFNSSKLVGNFPECVDKSGDILFKCRVDFAEFFAEKTVSSAVSMGFEGIYLTGTGWSSDEVVEGIQTYLSHLRRLSQAHSLEIFLEYDPLSARNPNNSVNSSNDLYILVDYLVVVTNPFIRSIKDPLRGNYTVDNYKNMFQ
ncbi:MAG: glycosyltransferase family 87 protein, partial [Candidatus Caldarchaeum sp.]